MLRLTGLDLKDFAQSNFGVLFVGFFFVVFALLGIP
jgi:hypothetical protein